MANQPDTAMLFAAGLGTRMGRLTTNRPKPLIKIAGTALIDHALGVINAAGVRRTIVNTHYKAGMIHSHLRELDVEISHEQHGPFDTGGGLKNAMPLINRDVVFTLNSDAIWVGANPLLALAGYWDPSIMDALLILQKTSGLQSHQGSGDFDLGTSGRITRGNDWVYLGAQIAKTGVLQDVPQARFSLNLVWNMMAKDARLFGIEYSGRWCDVGHPDGIVFAENMLKMARDV